MKVTTAVQSYVEHKRRSGYVFEGGKKTLEGFSSRVGDIDLCHVTTPLVSSYLEESESARVHRQIKYRILLQFFLHWSDRDVIPRLAMPAAKRAPRSTFVPYIFNRLQLRMLISSAKRCHDVRDGIDTQTIRTFILFLYGTGASSGEILCLEHKDIDLNKRTIRFRGKGAKSRVVPIGHSLAKILGKYMRWRTRKQYLGDTVLVTRHDRAIRVATAAKHFEKLRKSCGILRQDGASYQPRVFDLKCTFAVHRISSWIKNGADLNRMLPALAAYMGQTGLGSTEKYLALTPVRFQKHLDKLSPHRRVYHWRNDAELMKFLSSLDTIRSSLPSIGTS